MATNLTTPSLPARVLLEDKTEVRLVPITRTGHPLYVSRDGRVFSFVHGMCRRLKPHNDTTPNSRYNSGRKQRYLKLSTRHSNILIHQAVLYAWVGPPPEGYECDHLNGITTDNRLENLEWVTPEENHRRAVALRKQKKVSSITS